MRALLLVLLLSGCGALSAISALAPSGPSVEAEAQIGQENEKNESIVSVRRPVGRDHNQQTVQASRIENQTVNQVPWWMLAVAGALCFAVGVLVEPGEWLRRRRK